MRASLIVVAALTPSLALAPAPVQPNPFTATTRNEPLLTIRNRVENGPWPLTCADSSKSVVIRGAADAQGRPTLSVACEAKP